MESQDPTAFFWDVAVALLVQSEVTKSTMMGFPCLRTNGDYFASAHHKDGDLIVKLDKDRVTAMIEAGEGEAFAPNGRRFKEWIRIVDRDEARWETLMREAKGFVESKK